MNDEYSHERGSKNPILSTFRKLIGIGIILLGLYLLIVNINNNLNIITIIETRTLSIIIAITLIIFGMFIIDTYINSMKKLYKMLAIIALLIGILYFLISFYFLVSGEPILFFKNFGLWMLFCITFFLFLNKS